MSEEDPDGWEGQYMETMCTNAQNAGKGFVLQRNMNIEKNMGVTLHETANGNGKSHT